MALFLKIVNVSFTLFLFQLENMESELTKSLHTKEIQEKQFKRELEEERTKRNKQVLSVYYPSRPGCQFQTCQQIHAREVLLMKAINMHVFFCYLKTRKHFS